MEDALFSHEPVRISTVKDECRTNCPDDRPDAAEAELQAWKDDMYDEMGTSDLGSMLRNTVATDATAFIEDFAAYDAAEAQYEAAFESCPGLCERRRLLGGKVIQCGMPEEA